MSFTDIARTNIKAHEGTKLKLYTDSLGVPTIGTGRNLRDNGIRQSEADLMLSNDITQAVVDASMLCPSFSALSDNRKAVLVELAFAMGKPTLAQFHGLFAALAAKDWAGAAMHVICSKWADQVGKEPGQRAYSLAAMMRQG